MDDKWQVGYEFSPDKVYHDWGDDDDPTTVDENPSSQRETPQVTFLCTCGVSVAFVKRGELVPARKPVICLRERGGKWSFCATNDTITFGVWIWDAQ
jgi:hypothetical protein